MVTRDKQAASASAGVILARLVVAVVAAIPAAATSSLLHSRPALAQSPPPSFPGGGGCGSPNTNCIPTLINGRWAALRRAADLGNSELACYDPANAVQSGGFLTLTLRKQAETCYEASRSDAVQQSYTSDMIMSYPFNFLYGTVEARIKFGRGWPALWLLGGDAAAQTGCQLSNLVSAENIFTCNWDRDGSDSAEIDIAEFYESDNNGAYNWAGHNMFSSGGHSCGQPMPSGSAISDFHVYSMTWKPGSVTFAVDGVPANCSHTGSAVPSHPMFLMINDTLSQSNNSVPPSFPQVTTIDYVKVTDSNNQVIFFDDFDATSQPTETATSLQPPSATPSSTATPAPATAPPATATSSWTPTLAPATPIPSATPTSKWKRRSTRTSTMAATFTASPADTATTSPSDTATASPAVTATTPPPVPSPTQIPASDLVVDVSVWVDGTNGVTTPIFNTAAPGELLLAFVASDGPTSTAQTTTVSGAGLTWTLVRRANSQLGTAEIWQATAASLVSGSINATQGTTGYDLSLTVVAIQGSTGVGASAAAGAGSGATTVNLVTTETGSLVFGVGNDWDNAIAHMLGANQVMQHQWVDTRVNDTFWVQTTSGPSGPAGSVVTLNDTAPTSDRWNFAAVEVTAAASP